MSQPVYIHSGNITLQRLLLPNGLEVESIEINAQETHINLDRSQVEFSEPAHVRAMLSFDALANFLSESSNGLLKDIIIVSHEDNISVKANIHKFIQIHVEILCHIYVSPNELRIELDKVSAGSFPMKGLARKFVDRFNPVFSTKDLPFPMQLIRCETLEVGLAIIGEIPEISMGKLL